MCQNLEKPIFLLSFPPSFPPSFFLFSFFIPINHVLHASKIKIEWKILMMCWTSVILYETCFFFLSALKNYYTATALWCPPSLWSIHLSSLCSWNVKNRHSERIGRAEFRNFTPRWKEGQSFYFLLLARPPGVLSLIERTANTISPSWDRWASPLA